MFGFFLQLDLTLFKVRDYILHFFDIQMVHGTKQILSKKKKKLKSDDLIYPQGHITRSC